MNDLLTLRIRAPHPPADALPTSVVALALPGAGATAARDIMADAGIAHPNLQDGYYFRIVTTVDAYLWFGADNTLAAPAAATGWPLAANQLQDFWIQPGIAGETAADNFVRVFSVLAGTAKWYLG